MIVGKPNMNSSSLQLAAPPPFLSAESRHCSLSASGVEMDASASHHREKQVAFDHLCQVIPYSECKHIRKFMKRHAQRQRQDPSLSSENLVERTQRAPIISRPKYETKSLSVPLSPLQWGPARSIKTSLSKINFSAVDLSAISLGITGGASTGPGQCRGHSRDFSLDEDFEGRPSGEKARARRELKRRSSLNEMVAVRTPYGNEPVLKSDSSSVAASPFASSVESLSSFYSDSEDGGEDETPAPPSPANPKCFRMPYPTLTGWRRQAKEAAARGRPLRSCLSNKIAAEPDAKSLSLAPSEKSSFSASASSPCKRCEGPPVIRLPITPIYSEWEPAVSRGPVERLPGRKNSFVMLRTRPFRSASMPQPPSNPSVEVVINQNVNEAAEGQDPEGRKKQEEPVVVPLNPECSCRNCEAKISLGLSEGYAPIWSRGARQKWLSDQRHREAEARQRSFNQEPSDTQKEPVLLPPGIVIRPNEREVSPLKPVTAGRRPSSRGSIQADEIDVKRGQTAIPPTNEELEAEVVELLSASNHPTQELGFPETDKPYLVEEGGQKRPPGAGPTEVGPSVDPVIPVRDCAEEATMLQEPRDRTVLADQECEEHQRLSSSIGEQVIEEERPVVPTRVTSYIGTTLPVPVAAFSNFTVKDEIGQQCALPASKLAEVAQKAENSPGKRSLLERSSSTKQEKPQKRPDHGREKHTSSERLLTVSSILSAFSPAGSITTSPGAPGRHSESLWTSNRKEPPSPSPKLRSSKPTSILPKRSALWKTGKLFSFAKGSSGKSDEMRSFV
ncbi:hypothetical protein IE53DRAFT_59428 [Violaceomyces palustris]|uniref:Uncharacterized protein n=1 Tax=Violaceomyces palustris TaxID=1673888 RepID=A0ACD0P7M1_9BASI|nr:hypothetical protein IE53DRAFT_59428 [Violaceomyces palustris]